MTQFPDLFAALAAPFDAHEVKTRSQSGRQLHYVTARTVMNRLDAVLGPENWWDEYTPSEHSVSCRLTLRLPDGSTLTKGDAGGYAGMADQGDDDKSGFSDSFKRAAVKFGVGRYLYRDGVPAFVTERQPAPTPAAVEAPTEVAPTATATAAPAHRPANGASAFGNQPRSGRALFAWTREQEQRHEVGLLKYLNNWAKLQEFPGRMVEWDAEQVALAYSEAIRKLQSVTSGRADALEEAMAN